MNLKTIMITGLSSLLLTVGCYHTPAFAQQKQPPRKLSNKTPSKTPVKKPLAKPAAKPAAKPLAKAPPATDASFLFAQSYDLKNAVGDTILIKDPTALTTLSNFITNAIYQRAFPGCQILAAKNGRIIFNKSFGTFNYSNSKPVTDTTLYDIASCTKVIATSLALMKLYDEGKLVLNSNLQTYIPGLVAGTNKAYLRIDNLMMHQAGLKSWIPFYKATLDPVNNGPNPDIYNRRQNKTYTVPVANEMFMKTVWVDSVWQRILQSPLENAGRYVYSDLDLIFLQKTVEAITKMPLDQYVAQHFYQPLGLMHTLYNPWQKGLSGQCAPTENDMVFRAQVVQGYVHDQAAAMLGGVAGHAGLFSNKTDLAVIMQMLINGGEYNGKRYLSRETVKLFTGYHSTISRRGYVFDKPEKASGDGGPAADICSKSAFGHQGFTGTCVWADPATGIIFIFLSNRVYPSAENGLINRLSIRTEAQHYIYKALGY